MEDYKPNSHKFKKEQKEALEERKKVEKVISGKATVKKKSEFRKFTDSIISEEVGNVKSYIRDDVVIPAIKKFCHDAITGIADMVFYGSKRSGSGRKLSSFSDKVSYGSFFDKSGSGLKIDSSSKTRFDYDDIIFDDRGEAEMVLDHMDAMLEKYKVVTVADMYDMVDVTAPFTSNRYGWTNLSTAEVKRVGDGYVIKLPKALPIDR